MPLPRQVQRPLPARRRCRLPPAARPPPGWLILLASRLQGRGAPAGGRAAAGGALPGAGRGLDGGVHSRPGGGAGAAGAAACMLNAAAAAMLLLLRPHGCNARSFPPCVRPRCCPCAGGGHGAAGVVRHAGGGAGGRAAGGGAGLRHGRPGLHQGAAVPAGRQVRPGCCRRSQPAAVSDSTTSPGRACAGCALPTQPADAACCRARRRAVLAQPWRGTRRDDLVLDALLGIALFKAGTAGVPLVGACLPVAVLGAALFEVGAVPPAEALPPMPAPLGMCVRDGRHSAGRRRLCAAFRTAPAACVWLIRPCPAPSLGAGHGRPLPLHDAKRPRKGGRLA